MTEIKKMTKKELVNELAQDFNTSVYYYYHVKNLMRKKKDVLVRLLNFKISLASM